MTYIVQGSGLTIEDVVNVARNNQQVELHPDALQRIKKCRAMLEKRLMPAKSCMVSTRALVSFLKSF